LILETAYPDGTKFYDFVGELNASPGRIALAVKLGLIEGLHVGQRTYDDTSGAADIEVWADVDDRKPQEIAERIEQQWRHCCERYDFDPGPNRAAGAAVDFVMDGVAPF
jgi:hypothetical protein